MLDTNKIVYSENNSLQQRYITVKEAEAIDLAFNELLKRAIERTSNETEKAFLQNLYITRNEARETGKDYISQMRTFERLEAEAKAREQAQIESAFLEASRPFLQSLGFIEEEDGSFSLTTEDGKEYIDVIPQENSKEKDLINSAFGAIINGMENFYFKKLENRSQANINKREEILEKFEAFVNSQQDKVSDKALVERARQTIDEAWSYYAFFIRRYV